jgi:hypothetical protein
LTKLFVISSTIFGSKHKKGSVLQRKRKKRMPHELNIGLPTRQTLE